MCLVLRGQALLFFYRIDVIWVCMNDTKKRDALITRWRYKKSQSEVARLLGVSRQRVEQLERRLGLEPRRVKGVYKTYPTTCKGCGELFYAKTPGRTFCTRPCFFQYRKMFLTPEEKKKRKEEVRIKNRERSRAYYHQVFKRRSDWKDIIRKRNEKSKNVR
jgi:transcriptional regulator with XRE-family HTH domain